jgi:hypothetical protein
MEPTHQENNNAPSYWASVGIAAFIFSLITTVLQLISGYMQINSEPTGSLFSPGMFMGLFVCLIGAFGGMLAVWHYANEYGITMKLGKGALIGFLTGTVMVLIGLVFNEIWSFIDPDMNEKMMDAVMDVPEETKQQMIDQAASQVDPSIGTQLAWGIPSFGILNLLTGMLGVVLFARDKDN